MGPLLIMVVSFIGYIVAYNTYGKFLSKKIFNLNPGNSVPSEDLKDGVDYIPTKKGIVFGHHYTSIAGTGPIVGPAIGVIWGWVPALIWVFLGSIVMGAVHDFGSLVISMRNDGKSIADVTAKYVNPRVRTIFFLIIFLELLIVIAVFGLVIAIIFSIFPESVFPVWFEIPIALGLGWLIYKRKKNVLLSTIVAVVLMYVTVTLGHFIPLKMPAIAGIPATGVWSIILLAYAFIASTLPVTTLLQPRDYINAWQLYIALALLILGVVASGIRGGLEFAAPALNLHAEGAPPMWPFLFITIACGAISGFHSLVSSGTSSKQVASEKDAQFIGYGSMLLESALAVLAIIAVAAGIGLVANGEGLIGAEAWNQHYSSWAAAAGLGSKINAFVTGSANMLSFIGVPVFLGKVIMGVFVASFAGTTLDTATRIQRYIVTEMFENLKVKPLTNKYAATAIAVFTAVALAFATGADGKGALSLWPMFGAVNQVLAALALFVLTVYLAGKDGKKYLISAIPCVFMLVMTIWSVSINQINFIKSSNVLLSVLNGIILLLALWMIVECGLSIFKKINRVEAKEREIA